MSAIVYPFPVLQQETLDYDIAEGYKVNLARNGFMVSIEHVLQTNTLVAEMIHKKLATFYGTVSVRGTSFRRTETVMIEHIQDNGAGELVATQKIQIPDFKRDLDVFASTGVYLMKEQNVPVKQALGVSEFLRPPEIGELNFPLHSMIAFSGWKRFFSMSALFIIRSDNAIELGAFKVNVSRTGHLKITITLHPELFDEVEANHDSKARAHILCTALATALQEIYQAHLRVTSTHEPDDYDTQFLELAEGLSIFLESNGIPTWENEDFDPAFSASLLYKASLEELEYQ